MEIISKSPEETKELGRKIAADLAISHKPSLALRAKPLTIALTGELGSGKTTFVQGFAQGLGITSRIISPTFILMREYKIPIGHFYHVDLYRFEKNIEREVVNLGLTDLWEQKENIVVIEWAEKIKGMIPKGSTWIKFDTLDENRRKIMVMAND